MRMLLFYLLAFFLFGLPIGFWAWFFFGRMACCWRLDRQKPQVRVPRMLLSALSALAAANPFALPALILVYLVLLSLAQELARKLLRRLRRFRPVSGVWRRIYLSSALPLLLTAAILSFGAVNMREIVRTEYTVETGKDIPPFRVALIADVHYGTALHAARLQQTVQTISAAQVDLVVLCGDIVDENTSLAEMNEALELLGGIKSTCGTYYVLGNHDLSSYTDSPNYTPAQLRSAVSRSGITLLEDAAVRITPDVLLVGRRDAGGTRAEIGTLLNGADRDAFILVADHQPRDFAQEEAAGVDLTLSGHTHGGQIWPLGLLSQPLGFNDLCYGTMQHGSFQAIVTSGLSGWGYPIRTEHHSEYVLITVTPAA